MKNNAITLKNISLVLMMPLLFGCATMSKQDCQQANWYELGVKDGSKGNYSTFRKHYNKDCNKHGVAVNAFQWEQGRKAGLKNYCTPISAYNEGVDGDKMNSVCEFLSQEQLFELQKANYEGKRIYDFNYQIRQLNSKRRDLEKRLSDRREYLREQRDSRNVSFSSALNQSSKKITGRTSSKSSSFSSALKSAYNGKNSTTNKSGATMANKKTSNNNSSMANRKVYSRADINKTRYEILDIEEEIDDLNIDIERQKIRLNKLKSTHNFN